MDPKYEHYTYNDAYYEYSNRKKSESDVAEWFPIWCVGKEEYRFRDGVAEQFTNVRHHPNGGEWCDLFWVNKCIQSSKNMGQS